MHSALSRSNGLRIVDQPLWDRVKARQEGRKIEPTEREASLPADRIGQMRLLQRGFSTIGKDRFGCSKSRDKGKSVCTNRTGITLQEPEGRILTILSERLMEPELVKVFAAEYMPRGTASSPAMTTTAPRRRRNWRRRSGNRTPWSRPCCQACRPCPGRDGSCGITLWHHARR